MIKFTSVLGSLQVAAGAKCPFGYTSSKLEQQTVQLAKDILYPSEIYGKGTSSTKEMPISLYEDIVHDIIAIYEQVDPTHNAEKNDRAEFTGCLLRQAGHDFMDFRPDEKIEVRGGSDGCINFEDPDNKGIPECLARFGIPHLYDKYKAEVSLADFMVIIAEAAIGRAATDQYHREYNPDDYFREGTFATTMRDTFKFGRVTKNECSWNVHRMPNPEHGCEGRGAEKPGLQQIFNENIWKGHVDAWTLTAAISGAHTVGKAKLHNSGYEGFWSDPKNSGIFNNDYYWSIVSKGWGPKTAVNGNPNKNQWKRIDQKADRIEEFMLTTDLCLVYRSNEYNEAIMKHSRPRKSAWMRTSIEFDLNFGHQGLDLDPTIYNCCGWTKSGSLQIMGVNQGKIQNGEWLEFCGAPVKTEIQFKHGVLDKQCCEAMDPDRKKFNDFEKNCDNPYTGRGLAFNDVVDFTRDEQLWLKYFLRAWHIATENGFDLQYLNTQTGPHRNDPTPEETSSTFCNDIQNKKYCRKKEECDWKVWVRNHMFASNKHVCRSKATLLSADKREYAKQLGNENMEEWQFLWANVVNLQNPTMSSTYKDYTADRMLGRQRARATRRDAEYFKTHSAPFDWGVHASMKDSALIKSSCAITDEGEANQKDQWWKAEFEGGEKTIKSVAVVVPPDSQDGDVPWEADVRTMKGYEGIKVYVDDQICGTLDISQVASIAPSIPRESGEVDKWDSNSGQFEVDCATPLTGKTVSIRRANGRLIICDVFASTELGYWRKTDAWKYYENVRPNFSGK